VKCRDLEGYNDSVYRSVEFKRVLTTSDTEDKKERLLERRRTVTNDLEHRKTDYETFQIG
jgi:hypothetical protein